MVEISLLLFGLLRQNVTFIRMFPLDFSCSGKGKPFFGTGISLHFWHFALFEFVNIIFSLSPPSGEKVCKSNDNIRVMQTLFAKTCKLCLQSRLHFGANWNL